MSSSSLRPEKEIRPSPAAQMVSSTDQISHLTHAAATQSRGGFWRRCVFSLESSLVLTVTLLISGAAAGTLEFLTHLAVRRMQVAPVFDALADAGMVTLMTVALVAVCIRSARARRRTVAAQMRTASDLNHHLRNALQVIAQSRYLPEEKQTQAVFASLDRIDEALKRVSPN